MSLGLPSPPPTPSSSVGDQASLEAGLSFPGVQEGSRGSCPKTMGPRAEDFPGISRESRAPCHPGGWHLGSHLGVEAGGLPLFLWCPSWNHMLFFTVLSAYLARTVRHEDEMNLPSPRESPRDHSTSRPITWAACPSSTATAPSWNEKGPESFYLASAHEHSN